KPSLTSRSRPDIVTLVPSWDNSISVRFVNAVGDGARAGSSIGQDRFDRSGECCTAIAAPAHSVGVEILNRARKIPRRQRTRLWIATNLGPSRGCSKGSRASIAGPSSVREVNSDVNVLAGIGGDERAHVELGHRLAMTMAMDAPASRRAQSARRSSRERSIRSRSRAKALGRAGM
ncbi:MAG: hypothetical protein WC580_07200, partial [Agrococcus sp.]